MQYKYNKDDIEKALHTLGNNGVATADTCRLKGIHATNCEGCSFIRPIKGYMCGLNPVPFPDYTIFLQENFPELLI